MSKGLQITVGALAIAALLGWWGMSQVAEEGLSFQYFQELDEFQAQAHQLVGRSARVHGYVANDSIERDLEGGQVRFLVQNTPPHAGGAASSTLEVLYESLETPDLFKDGAEVVVEGRLVVDGQRQIFAAQNVMAKCPSKFEAQAGPAPEPSLSL